MSIIHAPDFATLKRHNFICEYDVKIKICCHIGIQYNYFYRISKINSYSWLSCDNCVLMTVNGMLSSQQNLCDFIR